MIIGAGFGGISAGTILAHRGFDVTIVEKNENPGGRCRIWEEGGYKFDMGPSWYLMPEVFEDYFKLFDRNVSDYFSIKRLDPNYRLFFPDMDHIDIPADREGIERIFDDLEENGAQKLKKFLEVSKYQYDTAMRDFMYRDYTSIKDIMDMRLMMEGLKLHIFESVDKFVQRYFKSDKARKILEYTMVFLGGSPDNTPALYSIMSHVDFDLGVWYPHGGMYRLSEGFYKLAVEKGVKFKFNTPVKKILVKDNRAYGVKTDEGDIEADIVLSNADYHHTEQDLLSTEHRTYDEKYWEKRVMGPSAYLMYLGVKGELPAFKHHNLYLAETWSEHFFDIFNDPKWPHDPSYYVSVISKTDDNAAPKGCENVFVLVPVASGLEDNETIRQQYFNKILNHMERVTGAAIRDNIEVKRIFAHNDFSKEYNAFKGTALGMSHTLFQTALFRCTNQSKKIKNLFFSGSYTHPGIGVPMVLISGQIVADKVAKQHG